MKPYLYIRKQFATLHSCTQGVAFIEFALCLPVLLLLCFGAIEVTRYLLAIQKVEKTIDLMTDIVARADEKSTTENLTAAGMANLFSTIPSMMDPYTFGENGVVIITDVSRPSDVTKPVVVNWQYCGGGTLAKASAIGVSSGNKVTPAIANSPLPYNFTLLPGEELIIGEIYYNFKPLTAQGIIGNIQVSRFVFFVPRMGGLTSFNSKC